MARITHFSVDATTPRVTLDSAHSPEQPITVTFTGDSWLRLSSAEAVVLRDTLSQAIMEQATAAAKALQGEAA